MMVFRALRIGNDAVEFFLGQSIGFSNFPYDGAIFKRIIGSHKGRMMSPIPFEQVVEYQVPLIGRKIYIEVGR